ncbi:SusE domain-containing protein [Paraflavisolibacter sp. H34]|uniref:SusE domain-containing protein n=1 Tax=Huijunlia imazamoxiresistens TaxID=3127457 RepID=UPI00301755D9
MKTLRHIFSFLFLTGFLLPACKKDEVKTILKPGPTPALTASASTVVLDTSRRAQNAVTFSWKAADFGYTAAVNYTIQLSKKGASFASASSTEMGMGNASAKTFTVAELNKELLKIVPPGLASDVEVRIKADLGNSPVAPVYSNVLTVNARPYRDIIDYPSLYAPGDYQGWSPATAARIASKNNDKKYEGYAYIKPGTLEFKLTSHPDWDHTNYGDAGSGKLSAGGGGNLKVPSAGYYLLKADLNALTWSATKTSWSMIGSATPGGWPADTDLVYNETAGTWSATANLSAGELKFRANKAWEIDLGDNEGDGIPDYGGKNIQVTTAGNYTITLDLSVGGNYSYTLKKN